MSDVENDIQKLLAGEVVKVREVRKLWKDDDFKPVAMQTVFYIVMAFIFDDQGRVVLIQEAKESCRGKWYPPAGRVEQGENFIDGVKREVLEETGLEFEPIMFTGLEIYDSLEWYRMSFIGKPSGGKLKTLDLKDKESLQAQWFTMEQIHSSSVALRRKDFLKALEEAHNFMISLSTTRIYHICIHPHHQILHRFLVLRRLKDKSLEVLCYEKNGSNLPCYEIYPSCYSFVVSLYTFFMDMFKLTESDVKHLPPTSGLLTVEHCGIPAKEHDGICLTTVFVIPSDLKNNLQTVPNAGYHWSKICTAVLLQELETRLFSQNTLIPFHA